MLQLMRVGDGAGPRQQQPCRVPGHHGLFPRQLGREPDAAAAFQHSGPRAHGGAERQPGSQPTGCQGRVYMVTRHSQASPGDRTTPRDHLGRKTTVAHFRPHGK